MVRHRNDADGVTTPKGERTHTHTDMHVRTDVFTDVNQRENAQAHSGSDETRACVTRAEACMRACVRYG